MHIKLLGEDDQVLRCKIEGDVTMHAFEERGEPLELMFGGEVYSRRVLLCLEDSNYMDSSGVSWLLRCHKRFREADGKLVIYSVTPMVMQLLKLLRMDQVFNLAEDSASARKLVLEETA